MEEILEGLGIGQNMGEVLQKYSHHEPTLGFDDLRLRLKACVSVCVLATGK